VNVVLLTILQAVQEVIPKGAQAPGNERGVVGGGLWTLPGGALDALGMTRELPFMVLCFQGWNADAMGPFWGQWPLQGFARAGLRAQHTEVNDVQ